MVRKLTEAEVEFRLECLPEDASIKGNCSAISPEEDSKAEKWIEDQLESGNEWAWCTIRVSAHWNEFEGDDYLGCCSYRSEADFKQPGGYYDDMKAEALAELNRKVSDAAEQLELLA
jgi:hypothetical protein